jgi:hypothetical protein
MSKEAMKLALEALEPLVRRAAPYGELDWLNGCKAITALREALAEQPAQPMHPEIKKMYEDYFDKCFRESSAAVPENFMDALKFDAAKRDFWEGYVPEPDKRQQALNKKAENARALGLDYEPAPMLIGNTVFPSKAQLAEFFLKPPAQQEPVAHQYQSRDGVWRDFISQSHYKATVEDGSWPIRALYTSPPAQQEPVAWGVDWGKAGDIPCVSIIKRLPGGGIEVVAVEYAPYSYTSPPAQRTWVSLTDDEKRQIFEREDYQGWLDYINAIEAKLKEKNT